MRYLPWPRASMRVGISAGDASFEDGDWFGTPILEASRQCTAAEGLEPMLSSRIVSASAERTQGPNRKRSLAGWLAGSRDTPSRPHSPVVRRTPHSCVDVQREQGRMHNQRRGGSAALIMFALNQLNSLPTPTYPSVVGVKKLMLLAGEGGNALCQPRTHAPPTASIASRPAPTVTTRNAIFFMTSSHPYTGHRRDRRLTPCCRGLEGRTIVHLTSSQKVSSRQRCVAQCGRTEPWVERWVWGRGRPTWHVHIESPTMRNREAPRANPEPHRA